MESTLKCIRCTNNGNFQIATANVSNNRIECSTEVVGEKRTYNKSLEYSASGPKENKVRKVKEMDLNKTTWKKA